MIQDFSVASTESKATNPPSSLRLRESAWLFIGQAAAAGGSLVGSLLLAHVMPVREFGRLSLALTVVALGQIVVFGPVSGGSYRFASVAVDRREAGNFSAALFLRFMSMLKIYGWVIGFVCSVLLIMGRKDDAILCGIAGIFCVAACSAAVFDAALSSLRMRQRVAVHEILTAFGRYSAAVAACWFVAARAEGALAGFVLATLLILISQYLAYKAAILDGECGTIRSFEDWGNLLSEYCRPLHLTGPITWTQAASERWIMGHLLGAESVAQHAILTQFGGYPATAASNYMLALFQPMAFHSSGRGASDVDYSAATRICLQMAAYTMAATLLLAVGAQLLHTLIMSLLPAVYWPVFRLLPLYVLGAGVFGAGQALSVVLMARVENGLLLRPKIVTAVIAVLLNGWAVKNYGVFGLAWAILAASVLYAVWMLILVLRLDGRDA